VSYQVSIWNNAGEVNTVQGVTMNEAKKLAKQGMTIDNRAIKISDAFGTLHHWLRGVGAKKNRWVAQKVVNDIFMQE
jgi:hypothetical protein